MTYDELLEIVDCASLVHPKPLLEVIKLHKPQEITLPNGEWGTNCVVCDKWEYPCSTIDTIMEVINGLR